MAVATAEQINVAAIAARQVMGEAAVEHVRGAAADQRIVDRLGMLGHRPGDVRHVPDDAVLEGDFARAAHVVEIAEAEEARARADELAGERDRLPGGVDRDREVDAVARGGHVGRLDGGEAQDVLLLRGTLVGVDHVMAEISAHHEILRRMGVVDGLVAAREIEELRVVRAGQRRAAVDDFARRHAERDRRVRDAQRQVCRLVGRHHAGEHVAVGDVLPLAAVEVAEHHVDDRFPCGEPGGRTGRVRGRGVEDRLVHRRELRVGRRVKVVGRYVVGDGREKLFERPLHGEPHGL